MAVKRYRHAHHRLFHRDAGYLEGRRVRKSREMRAMQNRTEFGREVIAGQWAVAEFHVLGRLWSAGAAVPYPVQLDGTELMMEFIGTADGVAAPRLAQLRPTPSEAADLYGQLREVLLRLAEQGYTHGDLSAYNVLVDDGRLVLIDLPQAVVDHIASGRGDCPSPADPRFERNEVHVIASASVSLEAAQAKARTLGIEAVILSDAVEGEAREVAKMHAALAREVVTRGRPFARPVVLLSGGETTVTVRGKGKGGRNSEFLLSFAAGIDGFSGIHALAADTDGIDGSEDNAGAFADATSAVSPSR